MSQDLSNIVNLINTNNFVKAEKEIKTLLTKKNDDFILNKLMGISLLAQTKYNASIKYFNKCYEISNKDYDVNLNLSYLFLKVQEYELVLKFSNEAIKANPNGAGAYQNLAECYLSLLDFEKAETNIKKAIDLRGGPTSPESLNLPDMLSIYADALIAQDKIEEFTDYCIKILDTGSFHSDLFRKLVKNNINNVKKEFINTIESIINQKEFGHLISKNNLKSSAHLCLGEYYSKIDQKKSEENYILANKYISEMQRQSLFIRQKIYLNIIEFFEKFDEREIKENINQDKGNGLIFIIGMPRSGTTLTESILSTQSEVAAGGEKVFFTVNLFNITKDFSKNILDTEFFEDLGDRYLKHISYQRNGKKYFLDKLPENFLYYKFIKLALPAAKFICLERDPWDNAISLFKEFYVTEIYFASSFFGISLEIANFHHLMKLWKKLDGKNSILSINYEELVKDTKSVSKKLWDHCGLPGEYLPEKRKKHFAATASRMQVKQDIYKTSLAKKEFLEFKDKFLEDLSDQSNYLEKKYPIFSA